MIPIGGKGDRKRVDEVTVLEVGPGPLIGFFGQSGAYGIAKYIPEDGQEMLILLDRKTVDPALPNVFMASVMLIIAPDMSSIRSDSCWGAVDEI